MLVTGNLRTSSSLSDDLAIFFPKFAIVRRWQGVSRRAFSEFLDVVCKPGQGRQELPLLWNQGNQLAEIVIEIHAAYSVDFVESL